MATLVTATWTASIDDGSRPAPVLTLELGASFEGGSLSSWQVVVSYNRDPDQRQAFVDLPPDAGALLDVAYGDGVVLRGTITCHFEGARGCFFETDQLAYGSLEQLEYELGSLAWVPSPGAPPVIPIVPVLPVNGGSPAPSPRLAPEIAPAHGHEGELFPYVFMRTWPEPDPTEVARRFVSYPYPFDGAPTGQFLRELAALRASKAPNARLAMQRLAVSYIERHVDLELEFVRAVSELPRPVRDYVAVFNLVLERHEAPPAQVLRDVCALLGMTEEELAGYVCSKDASELRVRLFQSYFALIVELGYAPALRTALARCLVVDHLFIQWFEVELSGLTRPAVDDLISASVVLPAAVFPLPATEAVPEAQAPATIVPYAIGDLHLVKQRLLRYALGELAHVESVMPGERRKSVRRRMTRTTEHRERRERRDDSRETRAHARTLQGEVSKVLADTIATTTYPSPGFSITYGPTTTLSGGWSTEVKAAAGANGSSPSTTLRCVREVVERAAARTARRVTEARTETLTREVEHATVSVHDNRSNDRPRHGVYRWLDEVYLAEVVRYGNRFVLELLLPNPGAAYIREQPNLPRAAFPPVPPAALGLRSFADVSPANFAKLCARYPNSEFEAPPSNSLTVSGFARSGEPLSLTLAPGYKARRAAIGYVLAPGEQELSVQGVIGRTPIDIAASSTGVTTVELNGENETLPVLLRTSQGGGVARSELGSAQLTLEIELAPSDALLDAWRRRTFHCIQRSYEAEREAFAGLAEHDGGAPLQPRNDSLCVERGELKRAALRAFFERAERPTAPEEISSSDDFEVARPRYLQFFDHAFEWRELSYSLFSPLAAGQRTAARDRGQRFLEFLEAEYAQVLLPVSPRQAPRVLFFLTSGSLWDGYDEVAVHESDVALASELKRLHEGPRECVRIGDTWEVVLPTTLAVLDGDGLENLP